MSRVVFANVVRGLNSGRKDGRKHKSPKTQDTARIADIVKDHKAGRHSDGRRNTRCPMCKR